MRIQSENSDIRAAEEVFFYLEEKYIALGQTRSFQ